MSEFIDRANKCSNPIVYSYKKSQLSFNYNNKISYDIIYMNLKELKEKQYFNIIFSLLEENMGEIYNKTKTSWNDSKNEKLIQLQHDNSKYLVVFNKDHSLIIGFCYFRFEQEDNVDVIYCYELQVKKQFRGLHIGKQLLNILDTFGYCFQLDEIMLTCFKNTPAMEFYIKLGFQIDETSPSKWNIDEEYEILSKECTEYISE